MLLLYLSSLLMVSLFELMLPVFKSLCGELCHAGPPRSSRTATYSAGHVFDQKRDVT